MTLTAAIKLDIQGFLQPLAQVRQALTQVVGQARAAVIPIRADGAKEAAAGLRSVGAAKKELDSGGSGGLSGLSNALKGASEGAGVLKSALGTAAGVLLGGAVQSFAGGLAGVAKAMIDSNAEFEKYTIQLTTLQGSSQKAKATLEELAKFGAETPFDLPEIVKAEKVLLGFGLTGQKAIEKTGRDSKQLRSIAGDIAAGTGQSFEEISLLIGKFSSGATGEAISRFQELGIVTKEQLKGVGIEFDKAGSLTSPLDKALKATLDLAGDKFGGGMKALSNSFEGQLSTLSDNISQAFRDIGAPVFEIAKSIAGSINTFFGSETFGAIKSSVVEVFKSVGSGLKIVFSVIGSLASSIGGIVGAFVSVTKFAASFAEQLKVIGIAAGVVAVLGGAIFLVVNGFALLSSAGAIVSGVLAAVGAIGSASFAGIAASASAAWLAILSPVGLIIAGFAAVTLALALFFTKTELGRKIFADLSAIVSSVFDNIAAKLSGVGAAIQGVFEGDFDIAKNFKKGVEEAEKAASDAKIAAAIAAQAKEIQERIGATAPALARLGQIPIETDKLALLDDQIKKLGDTSTSAADKANISEAIARSVPGAVQGIKKIADENGNLVTVYDLNIQKVQEYAAEQKKLLAGDNVAAIAKVKDGFAAQVTQLEQNKTALAGYAKDLGNVQKAIFDAQAKLRANPNDAAAKKQLEEAIKQQDELKTKYKETKLAVDENTEALRGTVRQAQAAGVAGKEEFTKLTEQVVKSKVAASELVNALTAPIVPKLDVSKLAEQWEQGLQGLKGAIGKNLSALGELGLNTVAVKARLGEVAKEVLKQEEILRSQSADKQSKDRAKIRKEELDREKIELELQLKAIATQQTDSAKAVADNSLEAAKRARAAKINEQQFEFGARKEADKAQALSALETEKVRRAEARKTIDNVRSLKIREIADEEFYQKSKIEIDKKYDALAKALTGRDLARKDEDIKRVEAEAAQKRRDAGLQFAKEDAEAKRKRDDDDTKKNLESLQKEIDLLIAQDIATITKRGEKRKDLLEKQQQKEVQDFIAGLPEYEAALKKLDFKVGADGLFDPNDINRQIKSLKETFKTALESSDSSLLGSTAINAFAVKIDEQKKKEKDAEIQQQNELELIRAKSLTDSTQREYALRLAQSRIARDAEIRAAGDNAAAIAQARLKYELDIIEATGNFRAAKAVSTSRAEFELRKAGLDRQLQEELAKVGDNEQRKLELIARIASQQAQAEAEQLAKENPLIRALFGVRETLYKDHYDTIEKAAEERRNASAGKEKEALKKEEDVLVAQLRNKEVSLEEYNKRVRALQLKAQGLELSGNGQAADVGAFLQNLGNLNIKGVLDNFYASLKANAKEVLSPVFKSIADDAKSRLKLFEDTLVRRNQLAQQLDANLLAQQTATGEALKALQNDYTAKKQEQVQIEESAAAQQQQLFANVALAAGASFGQMIADGQNFGKSLVKTLFGVLKSLIPIMVAQITGFSLASAESVATAGIAGVAKAALLTTALYAAIGLAESAVASALGGFRTGGYTGNKREGDVAGVVHGQEFVSTAATTRRERKYLEYIHTGKTSEQYFEEQYLPQRAGDIARQVRGMVQEVAQTVSVQLRNAQVVIAETVRMAAPLPEMRVIVAPMNNAGIIAAMQTNELREIKAHLAAIERLQRQSATVPKVSTQNINLKLQTDHDAMVKKVTEVQAREVIA